MTFYDHLFLISFAVIYPAYGFFSYRKIKQQLIENKPGLRKSDYQLTSFWLFLLTIVAVVIWIYYDRPFVALGIDFNSYWDISISLLISVLIILYFFSLLRTIRKNAEQRESLRDKLKNADAVEYLPKNIKEFKWFILLSISAGISEELLFRGYLFWYLGFFENIVITILFSSLLFGLGHSYQGWKGIIRTASIGLILGSIYALTDSLWILICLHILGDVYGGLLALLAFEKDKA